MPFTDPKSGEQLLSVIDTSRLAGVPKQTIYNWIERESIPCRRFGQRRYLTPTQVATELIATGLPLSPHLNHTTEAIGGNTARAYGLDARGEMPRITLPSGKVYYTTYGVAFALGIPNPLYLEPHQAAAKLGITPDTVRRRVKRLELSTIRKLGTQDRLIRAIDVAEIRVADWIRVADVASRWRISPSAVNRLCKQGKLKAELIGGRYGHYLIDPECVAEPPQEPITTTEFCRITGLDPKDIDLLRESGLVRAGRLGHNWRYEHEDAIKLRRRLLRLAAKITKTASSPI